MAPTLTSGFSFPRRSGPYPDFLSLLPEIVRKDGPTRPYRRPWIASGQYSAQRELAFEHTDRRFYPTAEPWQRSKPLRVLMPAFCRGQTTDLWNAHSPYTRVTQLANVLGAVISSVCSQLLRLDAQSLFGLTHQRKQLSAVVGITSMDLIVNDAHWCGSSWWPLLKSRFLLLTCDY